MIPATRVNTKPITIITLTASEPAITIGTQIYDGKLSNQLINLHMNSIVFTMVFQIENKMYSKCIKVQICVFGISIIIVSINYKTIKNLVGESQLIHKTFGFEHKASHILLNLYIDYEFDYLANMFTQNGMKVISDEIYTIQTNFKVFWNIVNECSINCLKICH